MLKKICRFCLSERFSQDEVCPVCSCITLHRDALLNDANAQFTDYSYNRYGAPFISKIFSYWMRMQGWLFSENGMASRVLNSIFSLIIGGKPDIQFSDKEHIADVGCGRGFFLKELPAQWLITGYDIVDYRDKNIYVGNFETMDIKDHYSIVRSSHSVEHAQNPQAFIDKLISITKDDGYIIISSPNSLSLSYKIFRKYWVPYTIKSHFCIMNIPAVCKYLEENGCKVLYKRTYTLFSAGGSFVEFLKIQKMKGMFFLMFSLLLLPITIVELILNRADSFIIYAKKI